MSDSILEKFVGSMTVSELCERAGRSVEALAEFGAKGDRIAPIKVSAPVVKKHEAVMSVATRLSAGQDAFDRDLLELLRGTKSGLGARGIAEETGASSEQVRIAISRLRLKKKLRFEGNTAARRYWANG